VQWTVPVVGRMPVARRYVSHHLLQRHSFIVARGVKDNVLGVLRSASDG
jgi:hypothetical protein